MTDHTQMSTDDLIAALEAKDVALEASNAEVARLAAELNRVNKNMGQLAPALGEAQAQATALSEAAGAFREEVKLLRGRAFGVTNGRAGIARKGTSALDILDARAQTEADEPMGHDELRALGCEPKRFEIARRRGLPPAPKDGAMARE